MLTKQSDITLKDGDSVSAKQMAEKTMDSIQCQRRDFLKLFGYGSVSLMAAGLEFDGAGMPVLFNEAHAESTKLRISTNYQKEFKFERKLLYMNIGTTGASPTRIIRDAMNDYSDIAQNPTAYFFGQQVMRNSVAPGFGCDPYELVFSFNTTDGLWRIVGGIPFTSGDEIITTNMEEDAGISVVKMLQDRYGVIVKKVNLPTNDAYTSDDDVVDLFVAQQTEKTKAILFSCPVYLTGARLPAKALCRWAADNNIISIVDGAHLPGMVALDLHDMGCDFFSGAGHKWQCGPGQTGFMYIRNGTSSLDQVVDRPISDYAPFGSPSDTIKMTISAYSNTNPLPTYFPTNTLLYGSLPILKNGTRNPEHNIAAILQLVGNGSRPSQNALAEVCQMWDKWGRDKIETYVVSLAQYLRARIVDIWGPQSLSLPYSHVTNPVAETGLTSFNPFSPGYDYNSDLSDSASAEQKKQSSTVVNNLKSKHSIIIRNNSVPHSLRSDPKKNAEAGSYSSPLRISTHLFHSTHDVDRLIDALLLEVPHP